MLVRSPERLLYVNPAFARIWGVAEDVFFSGIRVGESYVVPEDFDRVHNAFNDWLAGNQTSYNVEYRIRRPDGQIRWVHDHGAKIHNLQGEVHRVSGIVRDVTDQKRAEAILRESEERYRLLAENSSDLIMRIGSEGVLYASPASKLLLGLETDESRDPRICEKLVHPAYSSRRFACRGFFSENSKTSA